MRKIIDKVFEFLPLVILVTGIIFSSCKSQTKSPLPDSFVNKNNDVREPVSKKTEDTDTINKNEIISCSPNKIYRGETITIKLKKNHGNFIIIYPEKLVTNDAKDLLVPDRFYSINPSKKTSTPYFENNNVEGVIQLRLNTENTRKENVYSNNDNKVNSLKRVFVGSGWHTIMIGRKELVDVHFEELFISMSGFCRINYVDKWRSPEPKIDSSVLGSSGSPEEVVKHFFRLSFFNNESDASKLSGQDLRIVSTRPAGKYAPKPIKRLSKSQAIYRDQKEIERILETKIYKNNAKVRVEAVNKQGEQENLSVCLRRKENKSSWRITRIGKESKCF